MGGARIAAAVSCHPRARDHAKARVLVHLRRAPAPSWHTHTPVAELHALLSVPWALTAETHADSRCHARCCCGPQALYGVPVDAQALSRAGRPLADSALVAAGLGPRDATLQLALRMRGACTCAAPSPGGLAGSYLRAKRCGWAT